MKKQTLRQWLAQGDFNLALSSSFFGFFSHCGSALALHEQGFRPAKISGASAGALVGGAWASDVSLKDLKEFFFSIRRKDFWDPKLGFGLLGGQKFRDLAGPFLAPSFEKTKIPFQAAVFDVMSLKTVFLNRGPLTDAVVASCSVPIFFHPVRRENRILVDGGAFNSSGLDPKENLRTFCIYLENSKVTRTLASSGLRKISHQHRVLYLSQMPRPNPFQLDRGQTAFKLGYERTRRALDREFAGTTIEG